MLGMFSIGLKSLLFLAIVTVCLVAAFLSQLDDGNRIRQRTHIPHVPILKSPGSRDQRPQAPFASPPTGSGKNQAASPSEPSELLDIKEERKEPHTIDELIDKAQKSYDDVLKKQTTGVKEAAAAYRRRRGRQPPPLFDKWVKYAEGHNAVMVEDFFDQIYHDLDPFWAIPADHIRDAGRAWKCFISVREGKTTFHSDEERPWMDLWSSMVSEISEHLPDLDMAINEMDESRVMVPWEGISQYLELAQMRYNKFPPTRESQVTEFPSRFNKTYDEQLFPDFGFHTLGWLWSLAQEACPPDSAGRLAQWDEVDYKVRMEFKAGFPKGSYNGYIGNWTSSKDPCVHSHLREMHGSFVEPLSMSTTTKLIPMFGGSKFPMNNDILIPAAMYWTDDPFYKGSEKRYPWEEKENKVIWRGAASGGRNKVENWRRFQRHRFLGMLNGTQVHAQELLNAQLDHTDMNIDVGDSDSKTPHHFPLPRQNDYNLSSQLDGRLGPWTSSFSDAKFAHLLCFPAENKGGPHCSYTDPYFELAEGHISMDVQYKSKFLPDIDGNSFSGRYRGFLRSFSVPIKATVYNEWHDSRLFAWKHFVPMDNTFVDFYGIMEYFMGYDPVGAGSTTIASMPDGEAVAVGMRGSDADEVLRRAHTAEIPLARPDDPMGGVTQHEALSRFADEGDRKSKSKRQDQDATLPIKAASRKYPHDTAAKYIAESGHEWAEKVLRREDMLIYMYRLLLEYARIAADNRERMGWVDDGIVYGVNDQKDVFLTSDQKKAVKGAGGSAGRVEGNIMSEKTGERWKRVRRWWAG